MNTPLVFVKDIFTHDPLIPGHARYYRHGDDPKDGPWRGLHFVCPKCSHLGSIRFGPEGKLGAGPGWTHDGNWEKPTCTPSILHNSPKCNWHGYLTEGVLVEC